MSDAPVEPGLPESVSGDIRRIFEDVLNPALAPINSLVRDVQGITTATRDIVAVLRFGQGEFETVLGDLSSTLGDRGQASVTAALDASSPSQAFYNVDFVQVSGVGTVDSQDMGAGPQFGMGVTEPLRAAVAMTKDQSNGLPAFCDWANVDNGGFPVAQYAAFGFAFLDEPQPPEEPLWQGVVTTFLQDIQADVTRFAALPSVDPASRQILTDLLTPLSNSANAVSQALDAIGRLELKILDKHSAEIGRLLPQSALQTLQTQVSGIIDDMEALGRSGGALDAQLARRIRQTLAAFIVVKQFVQGVQTTLPLNASVGFGGMGIGGAGGVAGIAAGVQASAAGYLGLGATVSVGVVVVSITALFTQSLLFALSVAETVLNLILINMSDTA
jgi:hypothetical protein